MEIPKRKRGSLILSVGFVIIMTVAQPVKAQHIIRVYLDHNVPATIVINENKVFDAQFYIKKYAKAKMLRLKFESKTISPFKHSLEITNRDDSTLLKIPESDNNNFIIPLSSLRLIINKFKIEQLYYLEEPKNASMRIRSKRSLLMNLTFR